MARLPAAREHATVGRKKDFFNYLFSSTSLSYAFEQTIIYGFFFRFFQLIRQRTNVAMTKQKIDMYFWRFSARQSSFLKVDKSVHRFCFGQLDQTRKTLTVIWFTLLLQSSLSFFHHFIGAWDCSFTRAHWKLLTWFY
jgi:hypothetical protein